MRAVGSFVSSPGVCVVVASWIGRDAVCAASEVRKALGGASQQADVGILALKVKKRAEGSCMTFRGSRCFSDSTPFTVGFAFSPQSVHSARVTCQLSASSNSIDHPAHHTVLGGFGFCGIREE